MIVFQHVPGTIHDTTAVSSDPLIAVGHNGAAGQAMGAGVAANCGVVRLKLVSCEAGPAGAERYRRRSTDPMSVGHQCPTASFHG